MFNNTFSYEVLLMTIMGMKKEEGLFPEPMKRTPMVRRARKSVGRKTKTPLQKMHVKVWKIVGLVVKARDNQTCQKCGKGASGSGLHTSHVLPKSTHGALRYNLSNLKTLCYHCHINWWHKNPVESGDWFKKNYPVRWEKISKLPRCGGYKMEDLQEIYETMQTEYERLTR
jgi:5-methylcytosine-specific restriction endonuclease McrA